MAKGLYERRSPKVPGLENLDNSVGKTIYVSNGKGYVNMAEYYDSSEIFSAAHPSVRYNFNSSDNISGTSAVTTAGTVATLSSIPLDASTASNTMAVGFTMTEDLTAATIDFTIFGRINEATNAITDWAATTANTAGDIVKPTTSSDIAGVYYICTTGGTTSGTEPASWPTTAGDTVTDGTVVWTAFVPSIAMDVTILSVGDSDDWQTESGTTVTSDDFDVAVPTDPTTNGYPMNKIEFTMNMSSFSITPGDFVVINLERVAIASVLGTDGELPADFSVDKLIVDFVA